MEKYSVLMTVYENENPEYFSLALESIIQQTLKPDEIVLVKDGPVPESIQAVIDEKINAGTNIIQVQLEKNVGLGLALNEGIKAVKNELIARMDSDDYSMPERCERQILEFENDPSLDIIGCPVQEFIGTINNVVGERKVPISNEEIYHFAKIRDPFNHPTVMYKKSVVEKAGCYSDYRKNQDTELWIKMLSNSVNCKNLSEPLFYFRFDEDTFRSRKSWTNTKSLIEIRYKAWKNGFNSFFEFIVIASAQIGMFLLPIEFQKFLYKKILRN